MATTAEMPRLVSVTDEDDQGDRGKRIQERRLQLGLSVSALARKANVYRDTITSVESGGDGTRETTYAVIERALDELEEEMGPDPQPPPSRVVRYIVKNVYGAESLVVEGPVENIAELERSVDRFLRGTGSSEDPQP